jgi:hypothetical protein
VHPQRVEAVGRAIVEVGRYEAGESLDEGLRRTVAQQQNGCTFPIDDIAVVLGGG